MTRFKRTGLLVALGLAAIMILLIGTGFVRDIVLGPQMSHVRSTGKALIGGAFNLTAHTGKRMTDKDFRGKYMLVYFGYTFCPDICPAELQVMSAALDALGKTAEKIAPIFITVDPERDDVKQMAQYMAHFHKSFVGLTGTVQEIKDAAKKYRVYFAKVKDKSSTAEYLMDHSSIIYLMDGKGEYVTHFTYGTSPDKIAERIAKIL